MTDNNMYLLNKKHSGFWVETSWWLRGLLAFLVVLLKYYLLLFIFIFIGIDIKPAFAFRCSWPPTQARTIGIEGFEEWYGKGLHVFSSESDRGYSVHEGWIAIGAQVEEGCAKYPDGDVAVQIDPATFREFAVGSQLPFKVKLHAPRAFDESTIKRVIMRVVELNHNVSALYPLGLNQSKTPAFNVILTSGIAGDSYDANSLVRPKNGLNTGFLSLPLTHPRFEEQIVELLVHIYTRARAHPNLGPRQRHEEKDLKIRFGTSAHRKLSSREIDALVAGWVSLAHTNNADMRLERLYQRLLDYAGYTDDNKTSEAHDPLLRGKQNSSFSKEWSGLQNANDTDSYFNKEVFAPIQAFRLAHTLKEKGVSFEDVLREVHKDKNRSFRAVILDTLSGKEYAHWHINPQFERRRFTYKSSVGLSRTYDFGLGDFEAASDLGIVNTPKMPPSEILCSHGAHMEARLFRQDPAKLSERAFLVTHSHEPKFLNYFTKPFHAMTGNTVRELLKYGDVLVLNRIGHGKTENALSESYGKCVGVNADILWSFKKADMHISDTAKWLKKRGYKKVTGVGYMIGAGIMLSAASEPLFDDLILFNPWRGRKWIDRQPPHKQCGEGKIIEALQQLMRDSRTKPIVIAQSNTIHYDGLRKEFEDTFDNFHWMEAPKWSDMWNVMYMRPSLWRNTLGGKLAN